MKLKTVTQKEKKNVKRKTTAAAQTKKKHVLFFIRIKETRT